MRQLTKHELAKALVDECLVYGQFRLRSGTTSPFYFDKYRFMADHYLMWQVTEWLADLTFVDPKAQVLAGLETGGIPLSTLVAQKRYHSKISELCFVRKARKEYGTCQIIEGTSVLGKRVLVVEDVVTTGGAVFDAVMELRNQGAEVNHALCVIDRSQRTSDGSTEAAARFANLGMSLHSVLTLRDLEPYMPSL